MGNIISPELYVKIWTLFMSGYAAKMLLSPGKMHSDHLESPATPTVKFYIRGQSIAWATVCYCVSLKLETPDALQVCTALSILVGVAYPWNAKFDFSGDKLVVKYPMHYVPEVLMTVLSLTGLSLMFA
jgi:hypothetical protein